MSKSRNKNLFFLQSDEHPPTYFFLCGLGVDGSMTSRVVIQMTSRSIEVQAMGFVIVVVFAVL